jgi:choline dehydrogenase-like flavoprotein
MASAGVVVHDEDSHGSVGEGTLTYHLGDQDRLRMLEGIRGCAEVFFAAGALEVAVGIQGAGLIRNPSEITKIVRDETPAWDMALYASHPMGTCSMGADPKGSVVNPEGRVWEWDNLSIADASIFPSSLGVNPQVTVMAVGLTIGRIVGERL